MTKFGLRSSGSLDLGLMLKPETGLPSTSGSDPKAAAKKAHAWHYRRDLIIQAMLWLNMISILIRRGDMGEFTDIVDIFIVIWWAVLYGLWCWLMDSRPSSSPD